MRNAPATILHLPASLLIGLLHIYRATVSPDHGFARHFFPHGFCRHEPTCSTFAINALREKPLPKALWLISLRLLSCHPWKQPTDEKLKKTIERSA